MFILGITGSSGSGKGYICEILKKQGCFIIDADYIAHNVMLKGQEAYNKIIEFFSDDILDKSLEINRKKLASIVFNDNEKLQKLNEISHYYIKKETLKLIEENKNKIIVIDAPLLIEANFHTLCNKIWIVDADEETRLERIIKRDNITKEQALERFKNKKDINFFKQYANLIIKNDGSIENLEGFIIKNLNKLKKEAINEKK